MTNPTTRYGKMCTMLQGYHNTCGRVTMAYLAEHDRYGFVRGTVEQGFTAKMLCEWVTKLDWTDKALNPIVES